MRRNCKISGLESTRHACPVDRSQKKHCFKLSIYLYGNLDVVFQLKIIYLNVTHLLHSSQFAITIMHYEYNWFTLLRLVAVNDYIFFI